MGNRHVVIDLRKVPLLLTIALHGWLGELWSDNWSPWEHGVGLGQDHIVLYWGSCPQNSRLFSFSVFFSSMGRAKTI